MLGCLLQVWTSRQLASNWLRACCARCCFWQRWPPTAAGTASALCTGSSTTRRCRQPPTEREGRPLVWFFPAWNVLSMCEIPSKPSLHVRVLVCRLHAQLGWKALAKRLLILHGSKAVAVLAFASAMQHAGAVGWLLTG